MCFSTAASFGASVLIGSIGVLAMKKANTSALRLLAFIPFFFALQQFLEGLIWLSARHPDWPGLRTIGTYGFIFFAWITWPLFIPFVFRQFETDLRKKRGFMYLQFIGMLVALMLFYVFLFREVSAEIEDCSVKYVFNAKHALSPVLSVLYLMATVLPALLSRLKKVWVLGALNLLGYFFTRLLFNDHFISVWCFAAAVLSVLIWWVIRHNTIETSTDRGIRF